MELVHSIISRLSCVSSGKWVMSRTNVKCRHIGNVNLRYGHGTYLKPMKEFM